MNVSGSLAFSITTRADDRVTAEMPVAAGMLNPFGTVHAGAMLWFADVTATALAMGPGEASAGMKGFPLAISLNANLLGNVKDGALRAEAVFVKQGRSVTVVRTTVSDAAGKLLADVTTSHVMSK
jgi:1,4-dihydroxy-2-naphthoyl-CoA hydrolase